MALQVNSMIMTQFMTPVGGWYLPVFTVSGDLHDDSYVNIPSSAAYRPFASGITLLNAYDRVGPYPWIIQGDLRNYEVTLPGNTVIVNAGESASAGSFNLSGTANSKNAGTMYVFKDDFGNYSIYPLIVGLSLGDTYFLPTSENYGEYARANFTYSGYVAYIRASVDYVTDFFKHLEYVPPEPDTDPFAAGGNSDTGGGTGTFDNTGDDIDFPTDPTLSSVDTGFITLYNPTKGQLKSLASYMWSTGFDLDTFKKLFADPMDAILGMSIVPVAVPNGGNKEVKVGNISTGVQMNEAASQFVTVDCGSLNVQEYWGAYLDYSPYTKAEIYLPYIGIHSISADDIMGKTVQVKYKVDILSGACCAYVKCGGSVLYSFVGQCSCSIPITGNDWTNVVNGALSIAASIGTMVATGGASAPMSTVAIASTAVNAMKPNVEKSGSMGGMGGMMGIQKPYLILTRPRQALPRYQNSYMGYPSFVTVSLDDLTGYTEVESIHLENISATKQELDEIEALLKNGVIF